VRLAHVVTLAGLALGVASLATASAGPEVRVSNLPGPQSNATITVDPTNDKILLAGSNSMLEGTTRLYGSTDGGVSWQTWTAFPPPSSARAGCAADPGVAIDLRGRQYSSFVRANPCREDGVYRVYVVTRPAADAAWSPPIRVAPLGTARLDDKPTIAVDTSPVSRFRNRVYVAWSRLSRAAIFSIVLSHSDDGGRTWSKPVKVNRTGRELTYASIGISRRGTLYVAWSDVSNFALHIARSTDGGLHFGPERKVTGFVAVTIPHCGAGIVIPAQPRTCVQANPIVSVDSSTGPYSGRVYVSYARTEFRGLQAAHIAVFNSVLRPIGGDPETGGGVPVSPPPADVGADQFWPQSAVDHRDGALWMCFYDTRGDPQRKKAYFVCSLSRDGGKTWAAQTRASSVDSDETQPGASNHYGYYQGLAVANGVAHPIWTDTRDLPTLGEEIYTTRLAEADLPAPEPVKR
jgi:hypothetical protein